VSPASRLRGVACGVAAACVFAASPSLAVSGEHNLATEAGLGATSALLSIVYGPLKIVYVAGGFVLSGLGWMWTWGDTGVSGEIYRAALAGDYVVTPDHLTGQADIEFSGN
jgi:hypothetical protein